MLFTYPFTVATHLTLSGMHVCLSIRLLFSHRSAPAVALSFSLGGFSVSTESSPVYYLFNHVT